MLLRGAFQFVLARVTLIRGVFPTLQLIKSQPHPRPVRVRDARVLGLSRPVAGGKCSAAIFETCVDDGDWTIQIQTNFKGDVTEK